MENIIFDNTMILYPAKDYFNKSHHIYKSESFDSISNYFNSDFYGLGITRQDIKNIHGIKLLHNYKIEGVSKSDGNPKKSLVTVFTSDFNYVSSFVTKDDGKYKFENLPYMSYVIISEDLSLKYNHSIQAGVRPVEQS